MQADFHGKTLPMLLLRLRELRTLDRLHLRIRQSLRDLLLLLDPTPLPHGVDFPARKELETENCKVFRGVYRSGWECSSSCPYRIPRSE